MTAHTALCFKSDYWPGLRRAVFLSVVTVFSWISGCASNSPANFNPRKEEPRGFFERLTDELSERECNVIRFTCPYGLGPAGEPCECTDPRGVVLSGRTIK